MLTRLHLGTLGLILGMALLLGAAVPEAQSAEKFLALQRSLKAVPIGTELKANPSTFIGSTVLLTGVVNGIASGGGLSSFMLNCEGNTLLIRSPNELPACVSNGSNLRVLAKIGPGSMTGLSDLTLVAAIYDYDMQMLERRMASESEPKKTEAASPPDKPVRQPANLASRGGFANPGSRIQEIYGSYRTAIKGFNPRLTDTQLDAITKSILNFSWHYQVDPRLVIAIFLAESNFRPNATSPKGAMGLGQLMPGTARELGVRDAYDPVQNIEGSIRLIRRHLDNYNDLSLALSAYNAGPGAVRKHGGVPPFRETRNYIRKVNEYYRQLCGE